MNCNMLTFRSKFRDMLFSRMDCLSQTTPS